MSPYKESLIHRYGQLKIVKKYKHFKTIDLRNRQN